MALLPTIRNQAGAVASGRSLALAAGFALAALSADPALALSIAAAADCETFKARWGSTLKELDPDGPDLAYAAEEAGTERVANARQFTARLRCRDGKLVEFELVKAGDDAAALELVAAAALEAADREVGVTGALTMVETLRDEAGRSGEGESQLGPYDVFYNARADGPSRLTIRLPEN